ncbi:MAG: hypothetical protein F4174_13120 [Acidobacteria bacterium]|nr:hypothetical protein [Acidobacteriota bacterium]
MSLFGNPRKVIAGVPVLVTGFALVGGGCGGDPSGAPAPPSPATPAPAPADPSPPPPAPIPEPGAVTHLVPLFPENSSGSGKEGLVRIVNYSQESGGVRVTAFDGDGRVFGPAGLAMEAGQTIELAPEDLARANPGIGESGATGSRWGDGRLELSSDLDLMVLSYIRHPDGFLTAMHDSVPREGNGYHVRTFHPGGSNGASRLRLINTGADPATVRIQGIDDRGDSSGQVTVSVPAGATREFTAAELESGSGTTGALGAGSGRWRLVLESEDHLVVMNLMENRTGHLANLSTTPRPGRTGAWTVPLFPGASDPSGRRGLLRVVNHSTRGGAVRIAAFDDNGRRHRPFTTQVGAGQTVHLDSDDLEAELSAGAGSRRLVASSDLDIEVLSYIEHSDGVLTAMHDVAPLAGHRVATFAAGGRLRLVNAGETAAEVTVAALDDRSASSDNSFEVTIPANAAREFTGAELGFRAGSGNRRLVIDSEAWVEAMSLLESPAGHLANLSTEPRRDPVPVEEFPVAATLGNPVGVPVSVLDAEFGPDTHGQRITDTFFDHTRHAALAQVGEWGEYALNGSELVANAYGSVLHTLTLGGGIFWTATDSSPGYNPNWTDPWFVKHGRPFMRDMREFASWRRDRDVLFISSLENTTVRETEDGYVPAYCDDFELREDLDRLWVPLCGEFDDYVAHSGVGIDTVLFAGALDPRFDHASGAIRADGVFAPHAIYVEARDTSHATAVLAAYAVNLSSANPSWSAARLKRELMALAREETVDYYEGRSNEFGTIVLDRRTIRIIRREFAP